MYSENNKNVGVQRANNEFLRRMLGGELCAGSAPVFNNEETPSLPEYPVRPPCNGGEPDTETESAEMCGSVCGGHHSAPSLAMVYSPTQCWRRLLNPTEALKQGTQFSELVLPFEGYRRGGK
ncbi:MAG: spore coat associated protein CotJA [Clostridia bacterium]|nr:spore coat associated protein CotJA [Clostridia bacterium]